MATTTSPITARDALDEPVSSLAAPRAAVLSYVVPGVAGVVLWSVVCLSPLQIELAAPSAPIPWVLLYLQPLLLLAIGIFAPRPVFALVAVPISPGTCFFALAPLDLRPLSMPRGALTLAGALVVFLAASARFVRDRTPQNLVVIGNPLHRGVAAGYKPLLHYTWPRMLLLVGAFVVPLMALYGPEGQASLTEHFPDRRSDAMVLIHTVHLFIVILVAYLFFLSPSVNFALELSELRQTLQTMQQRRTLNTRR